MSNQKATDDLERALMLFSMPYANVDSRAVAAWLRISFRHFQAIVSKEPGFPPPLPSSSRKGQVPVWSVESLLEWRNAPVKRRRAA